MVYLRERQHQSRTAERKTTFSGEHEELSIVPALRRQAWAPHQKATWGEIWYLYAFFGLVGGYVVGTSRSMKKLYTLSAHA